MSDSRVAVELLPCPFCGGDATAREACQPDADRSLVWLGDGTQITCGDCPAEMWLPLDGWTPEQAAAEWNRRVTTSQPGTAPEPTPS